MVPGLRRIGSLGRCPPMRARGCPAGQLRTGTIQHRGVGDEGIDGKWQLASGYDYRKLGQRVSKSHILISGISITSRLVVSIWICRSNVCRIDQ